ncbi:UNVERIFIED_CONTAM: hypothetical protein Sradi_6685800 [Sesamum radiatum]|uniref:Vacuolar protein sorting-associated protein 13 VPS13 adaptor binding domain-containing protein n=1 Tax=Sesamum radiatum TaxID=300843 RepID=A0AAW2JPJ1_SESRA
MTNQRTASADATGLTTTTALKGGAQTKVHAAGTAARVAAWGGGWVIRRLSWLFEVVRGSQPNEPMKFLYTRVLEPPVVSYVDFPSLDAEIWIVLVLNGDTVEMSAEALGLTMESNGITILEPFDASIKISNASGKTSIQLVASDIFMNFSFSIFRLFLALEEDPVSDQVYAFWRPRAPTGFAVLGDYVTPTDKPPTRGVIAVNTSLIRVKRPKSFALVWSPSSDDVRAEGVDGSELTSDKGRSEGGPMCSIWFPEAPKGYVALGCVASPGSAQPPISSVFCVLASLVTPCGLRDCISIGTGSRRSSDYRCPDLAFWRVDNAAGAFLPADPATLSLTQRAYELRHLYFGFSEISPEKLKSSENEASASIGNDTVQSERSSTLNSIQRFEAVATFRLIWWNQGSGSRKKLSIWRPIVPEGMVYFGDIAIQGYEPPNASIVLQDSEVSDLYKAPSDFQLVGLIKKQRKTDSISFWMPQAPPGFVTLGCVACKGTPKQSDFNSLRCIRADMISTDQFLDESIWDTSDSKFTKEPFSIWTVGNELGTFIVWSGFKKPPKRFALKLIGPDIPSGSDDTVIDAEIRTFSAALFDDYGGLISVPATFNLRDPPLNECRGGDPETLPILAGDPEARPSLMVPLCNVSLSGVGFSLRGRPDCLNSSMMFSLAARYQSSPTAPGVASQLRITSTRDLNLNMSVSNANMILQAYASWNNLSHVQESCEEASSSNIDGRWMATVHQRKNYYIVPQNKLGKDIYIRASEVMGLPRIIRMPAGDRKTLKMPVPDNMLDSHLKGGLLKKLPLILTIIVAEAELPKLEGFSSQQYSVGVRVYEDKNHPSQSYLRQQSARTCGTEPDGSESSDVEFVKWNEVFFFKVDSMVYVLCSSLGKDPPKHDSLVVLLAHLLQFRCFVHCNYQLIHIQFPYYFLFIRCLQDCCMLEFTVNEMGRGEPVGYCCSSLKQLTGFQGNTDSNNYQSEFIWIDLCSGETELDATCRSLGRIKFAVLLPPRSETENFEKLFNGYRRSGSIQISPTEEGPWTTLRLNYGAPAACWRLGNDVVASEVSVNDGNRYVNLRSLVSVRNNTDFTLELCLKHRAANGVAESISGERKEAKYEECFATDEHFESQKYDSTLGWVSSTNFEGRASGLDLPAGWEWLDEWHVDNSVNRADGWVYAPDSESLKWPESYNSLRYVNYARQRRWIRNRKRAAEDFKSEIIVGPLKPGETVPLPLPCLSQSALYVLHLKPLNVEGTNQYSWSSVMDMSARSQQGERSTEISEICVSTLTETEKLLYCSEISGSSSSNLHDMWFCLSTQATEIAKDIHFNPIKDWTIVVKSPVSIANYLPLVAEISLLEMQASGHFLACYRGVLGSGETVKVYNADIRNPLYFSLLPQRGWLPQQEAVPLSDSNNSPSKTINLRSSVSGRIVQIILEQNHTNERPLQPKIIKVFSPFWLGIARCPPLSFRLVDVNARRSKKNPLSLQTKKVKEIVLEEITEEEIHEGYTIASALNFKSLGLSVSIGQSGGEQFGPVKDLSPLGAMDGSLDLFAYNADGNCMQLFVSSKPCPYQSVPTKVICVRPFMTFTNRVGQNMFLKFSSEDEPRILWVSDTRVSFIHHKTDGPTEIQVRMHDTDWSFPIQIGKEDTVTLVLKKHDGTRRFLRTEIRGFEEGSRFIVVFRLGSANGPIRIENRTRNCTVRFRQTGFGEDAWIQLQPLSTAKFSWEDPYGQKVIDTEVYSGNDTGVFKFDLDKARFSSIGDNSGLFLHIENIGDIKVVKFMNIYALLSTPKEGSGSLLLGGNSHITAKMPEQGSPLELIVELGVVGISVVDHKPRELVYLYMEKFFISYLTGYDGGTTSRFKLILGYIQLDNQLPLTVMPVLLAPEQTPDVHHPVFKMTVTVRNENLDGLQIYPYVYIRVMS